MKSSSRWAITGFCALFGASNTAISQQIRSPTAATQPDTAAFGCALDYANTERCLRRVSEQSLQNISALSPVQTAIASTGQRMDHAAQRTAWQMIESLSTHCSHEAMQQLGTARLTALRDCEEQLHQRVDAMGNDVAPDVRVAALALRGGLLQASRQPQLAWRTYREAVRSWDQVTVYEINADGTTRSIRAGVDHRGDEVPLRLPNPEEELHRAEDRARSETILESVRGLDRQLADLTSAVNHLQHCLRHPRAHECSEFWLGQSLHDPLAVPYVMINPFAGVTELTGLTAQSPANPLSDTMPDEAFARGNKASSQAWLALGTMVLDEYSVLFSVPHYNGPRERAAFDLWFQWEYSPRVSLLQRTIDEYALPYFQRAIVGHVPETELPATAQLAEIFARLARVIRNAPLPQRNAFDELYPAAQ